MRRSRGFPYGVGLVKNRYIGCTFITPDQRSREQAVRIKLGALRSCVEGRRVVMIDDSIVRGTTSLVRCLLTLRAFWRGTVWTIL